MRESKRVRVTNRISDESEDEQELFVAVEEEYINVPCFYYNVMFSRPRSKECGYSVSSLKDGLTLNVPLAQKLLSVLFVTFV